MVDFTDNDDDIFTGKEHTPIREDAFEKSPQEKIEKITELFGEIMETLGLDMTDDSLKDSPKRVAKMYVNEIFGGLLPENKPGISTFSNKYKYRQMLVEKDITVYSFCEHHFLPIIGRAHVAYISNGEVIGLSKINRIVDYYAKRPQVQERLTMQIVDALKDALAAGEKDLILKKADELNEFTRPFAERLMDMAVGQAMKGKSIDEQYFFCFLALCDVTDLQSVNSY